MILRKWLDQWSLRKIILLTLIAILGGVISWLTNFLYNILMVTFLAPFANEILMGLWCIAGPLAAFIFRIPVSALIAETLDGAVESIMGGEFGIMAVVSGLIQGFGSELGFAFTGYRKYNWFSFLLSAITTTIVSFIWDYFKNGYSHYALGMLILLFAVRLISIFFFNVILIPEITKLLERSHILSSLNE